MFISLEIENFRCFRRLSLKNLKRINLFAGMNNVGKTALLEAIFLHIGPNNPELTLRVNAFRGIEHIGLDAEQAWGWLFYGKDLSAPIKLASIDADGIERRLQIAVHQEPNVSLTSTKESNKEEGIIKASLPVSTRLGYVSLILDYSDSMGRREISKGLLIPNGLRFERSELNIPLIPGIFLSTRFWTAREDAERFSRLTELGLEAQILPTLRLLEPRLRHLALLFTGGMPIIHGDIGMSRLVPINMMGEGVTRLLSLLLTVFTTEGGCVLVDEIENGLHYSVMQAVWKALMDAARRTNIQIFATTHSRECILAAHAGFTESGDNDFTLQRLERLNEDIVATGYDQEMLATANEFALEVR